MNYQIAQLDDIPTIQCPCGFTRRAFTSDADQTATLHLLDVQMDARIHYHKKITEIYLILDGKGHMELDGSGELHVYHHRHRDEPVHDDAGINHADFVEEQAKEIRYADCSGVTCYSRRGPHHSAGDLR